MVEARCILLLLLSSGLALNGALAFHPVAQAMSSRDPKDGSDSEGSEEGTDIAKYVSEGGARSPNAIDNLSNDYLNRLGEELQKRGQGKNFLRFGKSGHSIAQALAPSDSDEAPSFADKRALRTLRGPQRNFLRFGKSDSPLQFGLGIERDSSSPEYYTDFDGDAFQRFTKASDRNFLRFGRSTESQMKENCNDCLHEDSDQPSSLRQPRDMESESSTENGVSKRSKRSVSAFYNDVEFVPRVPLSWATQYEDLVPQGTRPLVDSAPGAADLLNKDQKRSHNRSFLRYGRDPLDLHFLRFGKRGESSEATQGEDPFGRYVRARSSKNFLRFG